MYLQRLELHDFRSYPAASFEPAPAGITAVSGPNGAGKTNLVEAVGYLATLRSLRGNPVEALVRTGSAAGVVRAAVVHPGPGGERRFEVAAAIGGRGRVQVNGQALRRTRDLLGVLRVTVFSPDDLDLVKGGPAGRRTYLDDLLVALDPHTAGLLEEVERILRQRGALLKSAWSAGWRPGRPLSEDMRITLDVWDSKLAAAGTSLADARASLSTHLAPALAATFSGLAAGGRDRAVAEYRRSWSGPLDSALATARTEDLRRGVTSVGPHRDELELAIGDLPARTHASQGEQRTLALALRLAGHRLVTERISTPPVLLLDDVFSELDPARAQALLDGLAAGNPGPGGDVQAILTTASALPPGATVARHFDVAGGEVRARF